MAKVIDELTRAHYRQHGFIDPIKIFSQGEAGGMRRQLENFEAEQGPVFTENRPRPGDRFIGSRVICCSNGWPMLLDIQKFWM